MAGVANPVPDWGFISSFIIRAYVNLIYCQKARFYLPPPPPPDQCAYIDIDIGQCYHFILADVKITILY